jgi:hypothetical protein
MIRRAHNKPHPKSEYRRLVRSYLYPRLSRDCEQFKEQGKFPFEGGWYSEEDIIRLRIELKNRNRERLFGLILVFGLGVTVLTVLTFLIMSLP